jgi:hypothetical protein
MIDTNHKTFIELKELFLKNILPYLISLHSYEFKSNFCRLNENHEERQSVYMNIIFFNHFDDLEYNSNFDKIKEEINKFTSARCVKNFRWKVSKKNIGLIECEADITRLLKI